MGLDSTGFWDYTNNYKTSKNENDPSCDIINRNVEGLYPLKFEDLELCDTLQGYEVDKEYAGTESIIMKDDNCKKKLQEISRGSKPDEYVFMSTSQFEQSPAYLRTLCVFVKSSEANIKQSDLAKLTLYHTDCDKEHKLNSNNGSKGSHTIIVGITVPSAVVLVALASFITLFCMKRRGLVCFNKNQKKEEIIVHQNELYGNLSNQDYFNERYDTNIVDKNQYYEEEYEA